MSPAEQAESLERAARIKAQAMRSHEFVGEGQYCEAWISTRPQGSPKVGVITGSIGCGYPRDLHPARASAERNDHAIPLRFDHDPDCGCTPRCGHGTYQPA